MFHSNIIKKILYYTYHEWITLPRIYLVVLEPMNAKIGSNITLNMHDGHFARTTLSDG